METPVEIRYAGVVVARASETRRMTVGGVDLFLAMPEPLPAGTLVSLGSEGQARIEKVVESADPSVAGVYVKLLSDDEAARPWIPSFREDEVPAPRPPAVVVSPVIVRPIHVVRTAAPPSEAVAPRPAPIRVEPPRPTPVRAAPVEETPLPEVMAAVVDQTPPPVPFTAPMPKPGEQVALFDPPAPPPAVIENAIPNDWRRSTIVVAVAPPAELPRPPGAVEAMGEIDTGSRKIRNQVEVRGASIVVEPDPQDETAPEESGTSDARPPEVRLEELPPARALPPARGRATKRRRTTQR
jgi:hypothetical protein